MYVKRVAFSALICLIATAAAAQSGKGKEEVLFYINSKPTTIEEFVYLYRKNHQHNPGDFTTEKIEEYLSLFINYKLKVEEAISRGMDTTASFRKEYETYRDELLRPYTPDSKIVDSLVTLTYNRLKEEVNTSHILIRLSSDATPEDTLKAFRKISAIRDRALKGEDFGELAAANSEEPNAKVTKGNLGYYTAMQLVFPFEQAAYTTPVGQISGIVRTQFGYHVLKVNARRPSKGEVEVSHIMIRKNDDAKDRIFDVYDKLQKGMAWDELCAEYSEDSNTKSKGGRLRPFGVGTMASVREFEEAAFSLDKPGDISDPIETQFGWHILRLESKIPLPPFEEVKASLTQRVSRDERVKISRDALRERMKREFGYQENHAVTNAIVDNAPNILRGDYSSISTLSGSALFSMGGNDYTTAQFIDFLKRESGIQTESPKERMRSLIDRFSDRSQMALLEKRVARESPDYRWLSKEYYEGILLFEIMEKEIWNRAADDTVGLKNYFSANSGKYVADERMVGTIYQSPIKAQLEQLRSLLGSNSREEITRLITTNYIRVDSGAFERKDRSILSQVEWAPGVYMTASGNSNYLIVIQKILPPGPQTFEEARASVITDYQTYLEDSWIRELKRKFAVKIVKKAKKRAFSQLIDPKADQ